MGKTGIVTLTLARSTTRCGTPRSLLPWRLLMFAGGWWWGCGGG
jgi:hypothetical protein